ncbi:U2 small nuclear ribonucleoprotein auxiliary factor 35 kDa subunit-related protein 1-like isoform X2 [Scyliorhinus canicula]|nr:U2 small nuclear ribonucleoprotein auxiliary factor 35 kDa subunit-related protein 1-like isoform X2 [Scyliorhinus canicula]
MDYPKLTGDTLGAQEVKHQQEGDNVSQRPLDEERLWLISDIQQTEQLDSQQHLERMKRRQQREQEERQKQKELKEMKMKKQEQWRTERAKKTALQEQVLRERADRLKQFREFQRKVLKEESVVPETGCKS